MRFLIAISLVLSAAAHADKPLFSAEDVFRLNYASDPQVSPDGSFIVYTHNFMDIMEDKRRSNLWRINADGTDARPITTGAVNDRGARISPRGTRLAYLSSDDKGTQIFIRWLAGGDESLQLTSGAGTPGNLAWSPNGEWLAFTMLVPKAPTTMGSLPPTPKGAKWADKPIVVERSVFRSDGVGPLPVGFTHVFVVPVSGGPVRQLTSEDFNHGGAISWAGDSRSLYFSGNRHENWELDPANSDIYSVGVDGGEITTITYRKGPDTSVTVSPNGKQLAWLGYDDQRMSYQLNHLYVMGADGSKRRELLPDLDRSIVNARWASNGKGLYIQYDEQGETLLAYVSLAGKLNVISRELGGLSLSRPYTGAAFGVGGKNTYAFTRGDALSPADIAVGRGSGKLRRITRLNDNLLPHRRLASVEELWLKSSHDGRDIQAWVAKPPDFDPQKKYPLLLEIHGGPAAAYGAHFAAEVQLYAAAGYVVVYANPRGSTSYGEDFALQIHHNYPSEDYDDLISAVDAVVAQGSIDTDQLYVTGGSGGGVLTAWIVGKTDRFRAAVVAKPVINWVSFVLSADVPPLFAQYWFSKMPWEDPLGYWQRSPLSLVGNVSTPTMLMVGEVDWRTPAWESEQYYQALKLRGIDTALVRIPGASHSLAKRPSQMIAKVAAILAWFERHSGKAEEA
jgi:dipeptidyl aminopeptidase/acylaminoacyl peptidase